MSEGDPAGGTVRIPNRLIDALLLADLSKRQMLVALAIIRRTLGWRKPSDVLSSQQIADATGLKRQHVAAAILELANLGILDREPAGQSFRLSIRQDPDSWTVTETGQVSVTETVTEVSPKRDRYLSQNGTGSVTETGQVPVPKRDRKCHRNGDRSVTVLGHTTDKYRQLQEDRDLSALGVDRTDRARAETPAAAADPRSAGWLANIRKLYGDRSVDYAMAKLEASTRQILDPRAYILRVAEGHNRDEAERQRQRDEPKESFIQRARRLADEQIAAIYAEGTHPDDEPPDVAGVHVPFVGRHG